MNNPYLTAYEVSLTFDVSKQHARRLAARHELPGAFTVEIAHNRTVWLIPLKSAEARWKRKETLTQSQLTNTR